MSFASSLIPCLYHHLDHRDHHQYRPRFRFHCSMSLRTNLSHHGGDCPASPFVPSIVFRIPPCSSVSFSGLSTVRSEPDFRLHKFKRGPDHLLVLVHASSCNIFTKTFDGIDVAGRRLANEVLSVVKEIKSFKRISFLAHSLGGLFTRYAIAVLYSSDNLKEEPDEEYGKKGDSELQSSLGNIGGLVPINLITLATPHLGVRGRNQLPFLFGLPILERLAASLAPILVGRTGRQLFLTDENPDKPPLILRTASDCRDMKFVSSLASFRNRILYANVSYDHLVGWRTSSIRREAEFLSPLFDRSMATNTL